MEIVEEYVFSSYRVHRCRRALTAWTQTQREHRFSYISIVAYYVAMIHTNCVFERLMYKLTHNSHSNTVWHCSFAFIRTILPLVFYRSQWYCMLSMTFTTSQTRLPGNRVQRKLYLCVCFFRSHTPLWDWLQNNTIKLRIWTPISTVTKHIMNWVFAIISVTRAWVCGHFHKSPLTLCVCSIYTIYTIYLSSWLVNISFK